VPLSTACHSSQTRWGGLGQDPRMVDSTGPQLRRARLSAGLSLADAAERAGVSVGYLSRAENDHLVPTWTTLTRIAEALGCEPYLRLLPSRGVVAARVEQLAAMTPEQRLAGDVDPRRALRGLADAVVPFVVTGAVAGVLQGLPMSIDGMAVSVRDEDDAVDRLSGVLIREQVLFRDVEPDEMRAMCAEHSWAIGWCDVTVTFVATLPASVEVQVGPQVIQVVPLVDLVAGDADAAQVLEIVKSVRG
jgi:transcriptional regulator with XRE-family HTH domain